MSRANPPPPPDSPLQARWLTLVCATICLARLSCACAVPKGTARNLSPTLEHVVLVLDPGHGDRAVGGVPADPGAAVDSVHGKVWECVFTWDTAMRLKRSAEQRGATVFLTLQHDDLAPHDWGPETFPLPGDSFKLKPLVANPTPQSEDEALVARVQAANAVYRKYEGSREIYFVSIHFDSTAPDLAGMSFYYPTQNPRPHFADTLERAMREAGRQRVDLRSGEPVGVSSAHAYTVLAASENPDAYLIELGNMRSRDADGRNPDLWRMRNPATRQAYADLIVGALEQRDAPAVHVAPIRSRTLVAACTLLAAMLAAVWWVRASLRPPRSPQVATETSTTGPPDGVTVAGRV